MRFQDADHKFLAVLRGLKYSNPTLGGDPEFFIADKNGKILASDKFFPSKHKPMVTNDAWGMNNNDSNRLYFDGIQAEMGPCAHTCREFVNHNIRELFKLAMSVIGDNQIVIKPSVRVLKEVLDNAHEDARIFGCAPDFNAYTREENTPPMDASNHFYRYAGGHIHLGANSRYSTKNSIEQKMISDPERHLRLIKMLDLLVGTISVIFDKGKDAKIRRTKYGQAGCFRPTPYGVEYRTPSCWWLKSPGLVSLVYSLARTAWILVACDMDKLFRKHVGVTEDEVRQICNESDVRSAKKLWISMRPYIATIGTWHSNPYNLMSFRGSSSRAFDNYDNVTKHIKNKKFTPTKTVLATNTQTVFSLAAIEYMVTNGLDSVVSADLAAEWNIQPKGAGLIHGFTNGTQSYMYKKLRNNKDFSKYQRKFFEKVL